MSENKQLVRKNNEGGYNNVYPYSFTETVKDKKTGKSLEEILAGTNFLYLPYRDSKAATRLQVDKRYRRKGLWIQYVTNLRSVVVEYYNSDNVSDTKWADDKYWAPYNSAQFNPGTIGLDALSQEAKDYLLTNSPVNTEDITRDNQSRLQLADRAYNPASFSGKGYKILRQNILNGTNVLAQSMILSANTVYEIRYDYDLQGQEVTIPEGCILKFNGGSLSNGTIIGDNTELKDQLYNLKVTIKGTFKNIKADDVITNNEDISASVNMLSSLFKDSNIGLEFSNKEYKTKKSIDVSGISIIGNNSTIIADIDDESPVIVSKTYKQGVFIKDIIIDCNHKNNIGFLSKDSNDVRISNIAIKNFKYIGFFFKGGAGLILTNFYFAASRDCFDYCRAFYTEKPDVLLSNGMIEYAPIAIDTIGGNYSNIHIWGIPTTHNVNIGILQRHTNVQMTNIEFDSILSKNNETHSPEYRYDSQDLVYKRVYHGGCGILSLLDSFSAFASKLTINSSINLEEYNTPIYIRTINGNYPITDVGSVVAYGYNITKYSFADNKTGYKSNIEVSKTYTDFKDFNPKIPNGTVLPSGNGLFNIFDNGKLYRATNAKFKILSKYTYKLCDLSKLPKYDRNFIYLIINTGNERINIDISINNDSDTYPDINNRVKIFGDKISSLYFYIEDNILCMYNKFDYYTTLIAEVSLYNVYTEISVLESEKDKTIDNPLNVKPYVISSGLFSDKPKKPLIGFNYFCTDKQTTEGVTNGIMIYHKGDNVWVDALGRVVS